MNVLIVGAASALGKAIVEEIGDAHQLRLMDIVPVDPPDKGEYIVGSSLNQDDCWKAVRGMDAAILTGEPPIEVPQDELERDQSLLDHATRGTHNLCKAAVEAGVKNIIYGGTLDIFRSYPDDVYISELWKPQPEPDMPVMSRYLGELTCREFARDYMVTVTGLRLGKVVNEEEVSDTHADLLWLDIRDAAGAFCLALQRDTAEQVWWTQRWGLYHICADLGNPKYLINQARSLGYKPKHAFSSNWAT